MQKQGDGNERMRNAICHAKNCEVIYRRQKKEKINLRGRLSSLQATLIFFKSSEVEARRKNLVNELLVTVYKNNNGACFDSQLSLEEQRQLLFQ